MNAIVYLVRSTNNDIAMLKTSIDHLINNFINLDKVDIVIFHEKSLQSALPYIKKFHKNIIFNELEFILPEHYNNLNIPNLFPHPFVNGMNFTMGYRHMCRFFSGEIFKNDILKKYKNVLRLDTDSYILEMNFDLFDFVEKNNVYYGYISEGVQFDHPGVTKGLHDLIKDNYNVNTEIDKMYYTNFEVYNLDFFNSKEYMDFYDLIDKNGGIMMNRWGDAPIRYLGVNLFMNDENKFGFDNIKYQHGSFLSNIKNKN